MNLFFKFDIKQVILMRLRVWLFENKKIDFAELVHDLSGLYQAIEYKQGDVFDGLQCNICDLQCVYSDIILDALSKWTEDPYLFTEKRLSDIIEITSNLLNDYLNQVDSKELEEVIRYSDHEFICPKCLHTWDFFDKVPFIMCPKCEDIFIIPTSSMT